MASHRETNGDSLSQGQAATRRVSHAGRDFRPYRSATTAVASRVQTGKQKGHSVKALNVKIDDELKDEVVAYAKAWHISQAAAVKILLRTGLQAAPRPGRDENRREPGP